MEVPLYRQGLVARRGGEPGFDRCLVQSNDGSIREIRHDLQWSGADSRVVLIARKILGPRQWLGLSACRTGDSRLRQVDHEVSEHQEIPRRCLERFGSESPASR